MSSPPKDAKVPPSSRRRPGFIHTFINRPSKPYLQHLTDGNDSGTESESEFSKEHDLLITSTPHKPNDVEAQSPESTKKTSLPVTGAEYGVETSTKLYYLTIWFSLNLLLTIYNKAIFTDFNFPWLLTTVHTSFVSAGCFLLLLQGHFTVTKLDFTQQWVLAAFSFLFTLNIAMSNVSLAAVSVPFHQIMRSTTPAFTILIYRLGYSRTYSWSTYMALIPIIFGVALATYGDVHFSMVGFILTVSGVVLAALKTVFSNRLMTGSLALPALEILLRMSPLAAAQSIAYAFVTGEFEAFLEYVEEGHFSLPVLIALAGNGAIAFLLNVSSFQSNKLAGALTLTVAGNLKQCLTILLGIVLFKVEVSFWNGMGMLITVFGAALYSKVELDSKGK